MWYPCLGCQQLSLKLGFWQGMSFSRETKENWSNCGSLCLSHHSIGVSFVSSVLCLSEVLRFALNSCLYFALCKRLGGETSWVLLPLAQHCGAATVPLQLSCLSWPMGVVRSRPSRAWGAFGCLPHKWKFPFLFTVRWINSFVILVRFVFGSALSLSGLLWYSAAFVLL